MSQDDDKELQARWLRLIKEAIVLQQDTRIQTVEKSCKIIKNFYPGNEMVDKTCNLVIDNQKKYKESIKKLIGYDDDIDGNKTKIN
jgi:hypothetical protein